MAVDEEGIANLRGALELARNFAQEPSGWLVYWGSVGPREDAPGRRHRQRLSGAAARPCISSSCRTCSTTCGRRYEPDSRVSYDELFEAIRSAPVLVLDDLGAHSSTPWAQEKLFQLINHRYNARLPTVITLNSDVLDLDPRLNSRMSDQRVSTVYEIVVPSFRADPGQAGGAAPRRAAGRGVRPERPYPGGGGYRSRPS